MLLPIIFRLLLATQLNVDIWINSTGARFPEVVKSQAILESLWLNCTNCGLSLNNNLFGFTTNKMIVFTHWTESIQFYADYQKRYCSELVCSKEEYYRWLEMNWNAPNMAQYIKKLKIIENNLVFYLSNY